MDKDRSDSEVNFETSAEQSLPKRPKYSENLWINIIFFYACIIMSVPLSLELALYNELETNVLTHVIEILLNSFGTVILAVLIGYLIINRHETFESAGKDNSKTTKICYSLRGERVGMYLQFGVILIGGFSITYVILEACNNVKPSTVTSSTLKTIFFVTQAGFILKYHSVVILKSFKLIQCGLYFILFNNITTWEMASISKLKSTINFNQSDTQKKALYFLPAVSEYSVIGVAIIFEIMHRLGKESLIRTNDEEGEKNIWRKMNRSIPGIVVAILLVLLSISIAAYCIINHSEIDVLQPIYIYVGEELIFYAITSIFLVLILIKTRRLKFSVTYLSNNVDKNLLYISCFLTIYFCVLSTSFSFASIMYTNNNTVVLTMRGISSIMETVQIILQTYVIQDSFYRCTENIEQQTYKPGQNYLAILIGCNFALWIMKSFQTKHGDIFFIKSFFKDFTKKNMLFAFFLYSTFPLSLLYRFHSSACLASVFSKIYKSEATRFEGALRAGGFEKCVSVAYEKENAQTYTGWKTKRISIEPSIRPRSKSLDVPTHGYTKGCLKRVTKPVIRRETIKNLETAKLRVLASHITHRIVKKKLTDPTRPNLEIIPEANGKGKVLPLGRHSKSDTTMPTIEKLITTNMFDSTFQEDVTNAIRERHVSFSDEIPGNDPAWAYVNEGYNYNESSRREDGINEMQFIEESTENSSVDSIPYCSSKETGKETQTTNIEELEKGQIYLVTSL